MNTSQNALIIHIAKQVGGNYLGDSEQYRHRMEIHSSSSSRIYIVSQRKSNNEWCCSCMGWIGHRHCQHLTTMKSALDQIDAMAQSQPLQRPTAPTRRRRSR